jgi:hypothetical protein
MGGVGVNVAVAVSVALAVALGVEVAVLTAVGVEVSVGVGVREGDGDAVSVRWIVDVRVGCTASVGVGAADGSQADSKRPAVTRIETAKHVDTLSRDIRSRFHLRVPRWWKKGQIAGANTLKYPTLQENSIRFP